MKLETKNINKLIYEKILFTLITISLNKEVGQSFLRAFSIRTMMTSRRVLY